MHCRHCGQDINEKAEYCIHCGCKPLSGVKFCQECGVETKENQEVCIKCGVKLLKRKSVNNKVEEENLNFSYLDTYFQEEFTKIHQSEETYNGKWNWPAFFFTWIWAFIKGLWLLGVVSLLLGVMTAGLSWVIGCFYFGIRGNKMYYNYHVKKQQTLF